MSDESVSPKSGEVPASQSTDYKPADWFWATRRKGPSTDGAVIWHALRSLDLPFQWWFLRSGTGLNVISRLGGTAAPQPSLYTLGVASNATLGLSPYHLLVLGLATGSSLKQIYWRAFICDTVMPAGMSTGVAAYNTILNTFNATLALWAVTSQQPTDQSSLVNFVKTSPTSLRVGIVLYAVGMYLEWYSEVQRKAFKARPENQGKPYSGGLFGLARNINYGGYTLWRTGYSLICGGWAWGAVMAAWLAGDFCGRAIPSMDAYCEKRYGVQWVEVRRKVPYKLLPWLY